MHQSRPRRPALGELVQIDGSPHACFEDAAQFRDLVEDRLDGLLHTTVRVLLQPVAVLHVPDRSRHDQFTPSGLLLTRGQRALTQQIQPYSSREPFNSSNSRSLPSRGA